MQKIASLLLAIVFTGSLSGCYTVAGGAGSALTSTMSCPISIGTSLVV